MRSHAFALVAAVALTLGGCIFEPSPADDADSGNASGSVPGPVIFSDGFESGLRSSWEQFGKVLVSSDRAHKGTRSIELRPQADDGNQGGLRRSFQAVEAGRMEVWFYDDMSGCRDGRDKTFHVALYPTDEYPAVDHTVGVHTGQASHCEYAYRTGSTTHPSDLARTPGWHRASFDWSGSDITASIDDTLLHKEIYSYAPDQFSIGDFWPTPVAASGLWIDDVAIYDLSN